MRLLPSGIGDDPLGPIGSQEANLANGSLGEGSITGFILWLAYASWPAWARTMSVALLRAQDHGSKPAIILSVMISSAASHRLAAG
jgi:hypothetical protein